MAFDILIVNGTVVDGTGEPRYKADVGISGGKISAIGNLGDAEAARKIDAEGHRAFPTEAVSSTIFGGDDYSELYATTAMGNDKAANGEHAGALFRVVDPGVKGVAEFYSRVGL